MEGAWKPPSPIGFTFEVENETRGGEWGGVGDKVRQIRNSKEGLTVMKLLSLVPYKFSGYQPIYRRNVHAKVSFKRRKLFQIRIIYCYYT